MRSDVGLVLVSVLLLLAMLGLATGASLWLTRAELWAAGRARSQAQAVYTAEAGIRHGLAVLAPDVDWSALVEGAPAALSSPSDPGPWPIAAGGWVAFPGPPFGYGLEVVAPIGSSRFDPRLVLRSTASAVRDVRLVVEASAARAVRPYAPATLVLAGGDLLVEVAALGSALAPRVEVVGDRAVPAMAAPSAAALDRLVDAAEAGGVLVDGGVTDSVRPFDRARFARRSGLDERPTAWLATRLGAAEAPAAVRVRPGVAPRLGGHGVVLSTGDLDVRGPVDFEGVVVVEGVLRLGGAGCTLAGMVWAREVAFAGRCRLVFDAGAVALADRALRLPRLPVLTALARD